LLLFRGDLAEYVIGEEVWGGVAIQATAAGAAHDSREEARYLFHDKAGNKGAGSNSIEDDVRLPESFRFDTGECLDTNSDELRENLEETSWLVIFTLADEDMGSIACTCR